MNISEFYAYIEENSDPGAIISFRDTTSAAYRTRPNTAYVWDALIGRYDMTIVFREDPEAGKILYRDDFLDYLRDLMANRVSPKLKFQIALYNNADGTRWRGYLTDKLWSHIVAIEPNVFGLDNPYDLVERAAAIDRAWNGSGVNGGGGGF